MQRDNHGSGIDPRQYVGPYRMDKTLGKGQTGKSSTDTDFNCFGHPLADCRRRCFLVSNSCFQDLIEGTRSSES